ncbi:MAG: hypothetical protein ACQEQO_11515 [Thermodesulfobacteriota bacterium]
MAKKGDVKLAESHKKDSYIQGKEGHKTNEISYINNLWGIAGRQEIMEMRRLWQVRIPR